MEWPSESECDGLDRTPPDQDRSVHDQLLDAGWRVATVWECALRRPEETALAANLLAAWLRSSAAEIQIGNADVIADENAG